MKRQPVNSWPAVALAGVHLAAVYCVLSPGGIDWLMPWRVVVATVVCLIVPGAVVAAVLGFRSRHPLESLAIGSFGSTVIIAGLSLLAFRIGASIGFIAAALLLVSSGAVAWLWWRSDLRALAPRRLDRWDLVLAGVLAVFSTVAFRWGDDLRAVGWETALHVAYVRQYASGLPLDFGAAVLRPPEIAAQNYFYLWEMMLAVVARVAGVDAMVVALKARWCVPLLGFAAFFFMVQRVVASTGAAMRATWVMVAAVALQFLTLPPSAYDTYIQSGPLRQVGAFFGSIHHSDSAMEILLPLVIGILFWAIRTGSARAWSCFSLALVVAFLWHPREYFQVMWYGGVAILVDLIGGLGRRRGAWRQRGRSYLIMCGVYLGVAGVLYLGLPSEIRESSEHTVGLATQWQHLQQLGSTLAVSSSWLAGSLPFFFHLHGYELPGLARGPVLAFSWLILAVPATFVLMRSASRSARWLALYLLVLWLTSLCSYQFEQLLQAITYHEILISKPRLVHLFAYMVIGLGWAEFTRITAWAQGRARVLWPLGVSAATGVLFAAAWRVSVPDFTVMFWALNLMFFAAIAGLTLSLRFARPGAYWFRAKPEAGPLMVALTFTVFVAPASYQHAIDRWSVMLGHRLEAAGLFGTANPVELAPDTLQYFQAQHPPRQRLLVEPNQPHMVGVYAPIYVMPLLGNVGADAAQLQQGRAGTHPVFSPAATADGAPIDGVRQFLESNRIAHVLGTGVYAGALRAWTIRYPDMFAIRFQSEDRSNVVVAFQSPEGRQ